MIAALILAKGQSKRLANKNTVDFSGKPMFLVNVEKCLRIFDQVYVSSDDGWILREASLTGARPIRRSEELCGETPNILVYQHALEHIEDVEGIVAVQANSPTINSNLIALAKKLLEWGVPEVMTSHEDGRVYGSIWALSKEALLSYGDPYNPKPDVLIKDYSVDIHTEADLISALCQASKAL